MPRPKADLDALAVPKNASATGREGDGASSVGLPPEPAGKAYAHTLSLRLSAAQDRRLRRFVNVQDDQTGRRLTHQAIIERALAEYLDRQGG